MLDGTGYVANTGIVALQDALLPTPRQHISFWKVATAVRLIDAVIIIASSIISQIIFVGWDSLDRRDYFVASLFSLLLWAFFFDRASLYGFAALASARTAMPRVIREVLRIFYCTFLFLFLLKPEFGLSRLWAVGWFFGALSFLVLWRYFVTKIYKRFVRAGRLRHQILLVGATELTVALIEHLRNNDYGMSILGYFDDRNRDPSVEILGVPKLGSVRDLVSFVSTHDVDEVIVTLPFNATKRIVQILGVLRQQPLNVGILPGISALDISITGGSGEWHIPGVPLFPLANRPINIPGLVLKSVMDRAVTGVALLILCVPMLIVALVIKITSPGPVLFVQTRMGYKNREFKIYKFRTMHYQPIQTTELRLTQKNDPRVHRFGDLLRRTSFDELPQLLNVLRGDMSIVGPRPHALSAKADDVLYNEAVAHYATRHRVKPGITGWAQVNGWRGPTDTIDQIQKRVEHDLYYIDRWTLGLDLWIIFLTAFKVFGGKSAY
jgi:Undecaprenyl-phosphate glucose phosphotransferase